ncbi:MAG: hypothetical protein V3T25_08725 [Gemmatimonadota bacterium]
MDRRGIALPVVLLVLLAASALAASGFLRAFLDSRTTENHTAAVRSFFVAEAGLNQALATIGTDTAASSTRSYEIEGGTVVVQSRRLLRLDPAREIRLLTAEGVYEPGREGSARRTVGQLVLAPLPFRATAAFVSADTALLGTAAQISGLDSGGGECSGTDAVAGLAAPPGGFLGDTAALSGRPPLLSLPASGATLSSSEVDWRNASRQEFVEPEHLISTAWSPPPATDPDAWPVTYALPSAPPITETITGRGTLIVKGDLTVVGELRWSGLVLVAGSLAVSGRLDVAGAVAVGLDAAGGAMTGRSNLSGAVDIRYDGCAVAGAAARLARGPIRRPGGWFEVF